MNMEGKIVFTGKSKSGLDIVIRYPQMSDLEVLYKFANSISRESSFVLIYSETISREEELSFLKNLMEEIKKKKQVQLLAFEGNQLIGNGAARIRRNQLRDVASMGISILKDFRGEGIGELLFSQIMQETKRVLPNLRIFQLEVFGGNKIAINLYKKLGFKEYGRLQDAVKRNNNFEDEILMYKKI